jgi:mono/diheme cytochrome c family protein
MEAYVRHPPLAAIAALSSLLLLTACPDDDGEPRPDREPAAAEAPVPAIDPTRLPEGVTRQMVSEGAQLYRGSVCVPCHGSQGEGTAVGPALDDPDWINISHDYEEIVRIIEMGVPSPQEYPAPMPRMGGAHFTQDQLRAIGAYVFALAETGG